MRHASYKVVNNLHVQFNEKKSHAST